MGSVAKRIHRNAYGRGSSFGGPSEAMGLCDGSLGADAKETPAKRKAKFLTAAREMQVLRTKLMALQMRRRFGVGA